MEWVIGIGVCFFIGLMYEAYEQVIQEQAEKKRKQEAEEERQRQIQAEKDRILMAAYQENLLRKIDRQKNGISPIAILVWVLGIVTVALIIFILILRG